MSVIYRIKNPQGETIEMSPHQIMTQANMALQPAGKAIQAITPDGLTAQIIQNGQAFTVPLTNFLKAGGMQIESALPAEQNTDFSMVNPAWRFGVANLSDDAQKASYLRSKLEKEGINDPQIVGSGRDFFFYDAPSGKWQALTNSPEWDLADLAEAGQMVPGMIGGAVGMGIGATAGTAAMPVAGTVAGGAAGGAAGTAMGETAVRGLAAAVDPEYREAFDLGGAAKDVAISSAIGGAMPIAAKGLGTVAKPILGKALPYAASPISTATQAAGRVGQIGGKIAQGGAIANTRAGRFLGSMLTPGISDVALMGALAEIPEMAVRGTGKVGQKLGATKMFAGDTAEEIMSSLGRTLGGKMGGGRLGPRADDISKALQTGAEEGLAAARQFGPITPQMARDVAKRGAATAARPYVASGARAGQEGGEQFMRQLGQGVEGLGKAGRGVMQLAEDVVGLGGRAVAGAGRRAESLGTMMGKAAPAMRRWEPAVLAQGAGRPLVPGKMQAPMEMPQAYPGMQMRGYGQPAPSIPQGGQVPIAAQPRATLPSWYMPYDLEI
jgi:hypothetical protein